MQGSCVARGLLQFNICQSFTAPECYYYIIIALKNLFNECKVMHAEGWIWGATNCLFSSTWPSRGKQAKVFAWLLVLECITSRFILLAHASLVDTTTLADIREFQFEPARLMNVFLRMGICKCSTFTLLTRAHCAFSCFWPYFWNSLSMHSCTVTFDFIFCYHKTRLFRQPRVKHVCER